MRILFFSFFVFAISCNNEVSQPETNTKNHIDSTIQKVSIEDSQFHFLKNDLFVDDSGNIAYRAFDQTVPGDIRNRFLTTVYNYDTIRSQGQELRFVVDTSTFVSLGDLYYRDKKFIYYHFPMIDGGTFYIIWEADPKSFKVFGESWYAKDKHNIFCRGSILENADYKTFTILPLISKGDTIRWLGKDKNHVYDSNDTLDQQTLKDWNVRL